MVLMYKPSVIDSPSGRSPKEAPRWDLTGTEGCGGGKVVSWLSAIDLGYVDIYRRKKYFGGATGGPRGWRAPPWARPLPRGCLEAPPTYSFLLYIPTYPQTIRTGAKNLIPPPQPSVSRRSHLGACFGAPPEGASTTVGFYINTIAPPMKCE